MQGGQGHHGFGILGIPSAAAVFYAVGGGIAVGFSGTAAYLPGFDLELGIADHLAAIGHVLHQAVGRGALGGTAKRPPQAARAFWAFSCRW